MVTNTFFLFAQGANNNPLSKLHGGIFKTLPLQVMPYKTRISLNSKNGKFALIIGFECVFFCGQINFHDFSSQINFHDFSSQIDFHGFSIPVLSY